VPLFSAEKEFSPFVFNKVNPFFPTENEENGSIFTSPFFTVQLAGLSLPGEDSYWLSLIFPPFFLSAKESILFFRFSSMIQLGGVFRPLPTLCREPFRYIVCAALIFPEYLFGGGFTLCLGRCRTRDVGFF